MAKGLGILAAAYWAVTLVAAVEMVRGNPTALKAVVGVGFEAVVMSWAAREMRRQEQELRRLDRR